jgi:hypothetical protein
LAVAHADRSAEVNTVPFAGRFSAGGGAVSVASGEVVGDAAGVGADAALRCDGTDVTCDLNAVCNDAAAGFDDPVAGSVSAAAGMAHATVPPPISKAHAASIPTADRNGRRSLRTAHSAPAVDRDSSPLRARK